MRSRCALQHATPAKSALLTPLTHKTHSHSEFDELVELRLGSFKFANFICFLISYIYVALLSRLFYLQALVLAKRKCDSSVPPLFGLPLFGLLAICSLALLLGCTPTAARPIIGTGMSAAHCLHLFYVLFLALFLCSPNMTLRANLRSIR